MNADISAALYLVATVLFILGLKGLSSPRTALRGNTFAMIGMAIAIGLTLLHQDVQNYTWIVAGIVGGALIGTPLARKIQMTAMPQLVAALHSFVGLSAVCVATGTLITHGAHGMNAVLQIEAAVGCMIGAVTFTGSLIAFGKLQEILKSEPLVFKGQHLLNLVLFLAIAGLCAYFVMNPEALWAYGVMTVLSLLLGFLIVLPIGGGDMPVVVSMLNSYSGWAASATGFTLNNYLLISTGALVGSSGAILSYIMCKAMNRSFFSVILGGVGAAVTSSGGASGAKKNYKSASADDAAFMFENSSKVIIVPGYGMAVAQAQHSVKELYYALREKGLEVKFAIHPVAGRMPGHMNVLLAEAEIPYEDVLELDEINPEFTTAEAVLVIGANDVVNPAAKTDKTSPLYGMPILDAYKSKVVYIIKRSMKPGYSGVDNDLFYYDNCQLVFGDAKVVCENVTKALKGTGH